MGEARASQGEQQKKDPATWASGRQGAFHVGRHFQEVGPGLGLLYEARHVKTGASALLFRAGEGVEWRSAGPWRVCLSCGTQDSTVTLEVAEAPAEVPVKELANILVMMTAALERVEDNPQLQAHLAGAPVKPVRRWARRAESFLGSRGPGALAGLALLASGLGLWLGLFRGPASPSSEDAWPQTGALFLTSSAQPETIGISYPMPSKPFSNQAIAPCYPELGDETINGGCWVELAQRPPCLKLQAEHKGKCYLPISKDRDRGEKRLPQSAKP